MAGLVSLIIMPPLYGMIPSLGDEPAGGMMSMPLLNQDWSCLLGEFFLKATVSRFFEPVSLRAAWK